MSQTASPTKQSVLDRFFEITKRGSTVATEIRGGIVTFFTMAYIVILNPLILSGVPDVTGNELDFGQVGATTSLAAGVMSVMFGLAARLPFGFAAGLGINSFLAASVVGSLTWPEAMGLVVINGVIITLLGATGARLAIFRAVPQQLKAAISVGIGFFIAFIGFVDSGFVNGGNASPPVGLGQGGSITSIPVVIFVIALVLIAVLMVLRVPGAILIGIVVSTIIAMIAQSIAKLGLAVDNPNGWHMSIPELPSSVFALPDFALVGAVDVFGSFGRIGAIAAIMLVFTLVFTNFFDAMGTMTGVAREAGLSDENDEFPRIKSAFVVEGIGAIVGGATSSSSNTVYVESAAGVGEGARTGLAAVVLGLLFLLSTFLTPLTSTVPIEVGGAALVAVGGLMISQIRHIDFTRFEVALPAFLTIAGMPFTYSIANGIGIGFVSWVIIRLFAGKAKEVHWLMWIVSAGFVIYFARGPIETLLG